MIRFVVGFAIGAWAGFCMAAIMVVMADEKRRGQ